MVGDRFSRHPYGREGKGTVVTVRASTAADMRDYVRRTFARAD